MNTIGQVTLREADSKDAPTLVRLMQAAFQEYEGVLDPATGLTKVLCISDGCQCCQTGATKASEPRCGIGYFFEAWHVFRLRRLATQAGRRERDSQKHESV